MKATFSAALREIAAHMEKHDLSQDVTVSLTHGRPEEVAAVQLRDDDFDVWAAVTPGEDRVRIVGGGDAFVAREVVISGIPMQLYSLRRPASPPAH